MFSKLSLANKFLKTVGLIAVLGMGDPELTKECQSNALPVVVCETKKSTNTKSTQHKYRNPGDLPTEYFTKKSGPSWTRVRVESHTHAEDEYKALDRIRLIDQSKSFGISPWQVIKQRIVTLDKDRAATVQEKADEEALLELLNKYVSSKMPNPAVDNVEPKEEVTEPYLAHCLSDLTQLQQLMNRYFEHFTVAKRKGYFDDFIREVAQERRIFAEVLEQTKTQRLPTGLSLEDVLSYRRCGFSTDAIGLLKRTGLSPVIAREALLSRTLPLSEVAQFSTLGFSLSEARKFKASGKNLTDAIHLKRVAMDIGWNMAGWEMVEWSNRRLSASHLQAWLTHQLTDEDFHLVITRNAITNPKELEIALSIVETGQSMKDALWIIARGASHRRVIKRLESHQARSEKILRQALKQKEKHKEHGLSLEAAYAYRSKSTIAVEDAKRVGDFYSDNLVGSSSKLYGGMISSVQKTNVFVGSKKNLQRTETFVFKKEKPKKLPKNILIQAGIDSETPRLSAREEATKRISDLLGFNLIGHTEIGLKDGAMGIYMEVAPGVAPAFRETIDITDTPKGNAVIVARARFGNRQEIYDQLAKKFDAEDVRILNNRVYMTYCSIVTVDAKDAGLREWMTKLQLLDLLTGQVDRHAGNYHIRLDEDGKVAQVTGIDNELSFGAALTRPNDIAKGGVEAAFWRKGVRLPPIVDKEMKAAFDQLDEEKIRNEVGDLLTEKEIKALLSRLRRIKNHLQLCEQKHLVINQSKWGDKETTGLLQFFANHQNSYWCRDFVEAPKFDTYKVSYQKALEARQC